MNKAWPPLRPWRIQLIPYDYSRNQPDNLLAWKLGEAVREAAAHPGGDLIDQGLSLLRALETRGLGVVDLP